MNIYRKCTDKPYYFLTIDTTLPTNNSKKNLQINLTVIQIKNQLKSLELSSKYNCLIGEDLGYASGVAEQT